MLLPAGGCVAEQFVHPDPEISIENLENTVRFLAALDPPRSHNHPGSLKRSADYITQKLKEYGLEPAEQVFRVDGRAYANVVAGVGPAERSRLVVGAHYDVCGERPGADDNASGIAALLEVARFAGQHESELGYRVEFVAYTLEEPPFFRTKAMGSYVHARQLHDSGVRVKGMICLEMLGFFSDAKDSQSYPLPLLGLFYPTTANFISVVSRPGLSSLPGQMVKHLRATSVPVTSLSAPAFIEGVDFSDHLNYWKFGYDAIMITDTAFCRNPHYHRDTDTPDTLDYARMGEVVKGVCWCILNMK